MRYRYLAFALAAAMLLVGCSGQASKTAGPAAEKSATPAPSVTTTPVAPYPSRLPNDDARTVLLPGGDMDKLRGNVWDNLDRLTSMHVEEVVRDGDERLRLSFDVTSRDGRCSGTMNDGTGPPVRFVTAGNSQLWMSTDRGPDAGWQVVSHGEFMAQRCVVGPEGVVLAIDEKAFYPGWILDHATRIGEEEIAGHHAVRYRQSDGPTTYDLWITAVGRQARIVKLLALPGGEDFTRLMLSQFDSAGPITPVPRQDQIVVPPNKSRDV